MTDGHQLRVFNSLGRRVEDFIPSGDVTGMYSCGPTVYAYQHLGNMRAYVFADTVRRALGWKGLRVRHVVNITDVGHGVSDADTGEDKMEVAAARERRSVLEIAESYTNAFFDDLAALNVLPAEAYPRASAYVPQTIEFAAVLEERGYTSARTSTSTPAGWTTASCTTSTRSRRARPSWPTAGDGHRRGSGTRADQIRAELDALGVQLTDTPEGPVWHLR